MENSTYAEGGVVPYTQVARVNEEGGEIQVLRGGTTVVPHDISKIMAKRAGLLMANAAGFSGGSNINITINGSGLSESQLESTMLRAMRRSGY